eukprot:748619-Hanusia_phi.AAC.2
MFRRLGIQRRQQAKDLSATRPSCLAPAQRVRSLKTRRPSDDSALQALGRGTRCQLRPSRLARLAAGGE